MSFSPSTLHPHTIPLKIILVKGYVLYSSTLLLDICSATQKKALKKPCLEKPT